MKHFATLKSVEKWNNNDSYTYVEYLFPWEKKSLFPSHVFLVLGTIGIFRNLERP